MGYITQYSLTVVRMSDKSPISDEDLANIIKNPKYDLLYPLQEDGTCNEPCKWYDHEENMRALSKDYPDLLFELHGVGEENDDMWYTYFNNGKMQHCPAIIQYEDFDPKKLK